MRSVPARKQYRSNAVRVAAGVLVGLLIIGGLSIRPTVTWAADPLPTLSDPTLKASTVVAGLVLPTTMAFLGPDDFLVLQKNDGTVWRVVAGVLGAEPVLDVAVDSEENNGLLGIAVHPNFPATPFVYLYYTASDTGEDTDGVPLPAANRVARYTWDGSRLVDPFVLLDLPISLDAEHDAGIMTFGTDGKLYVVIGDLHRMGQLQNVADGAPPDDSSVIIRLNDDGSVPADNPFSAQGEPVAKYFAYGIRNVFGMAVDPITGALWQTENGQDEYDEINRIEPGMNSGWLQIMGPDARDPQAEADLFHLPGSSYRDPVFSWFEQMAPTGMAFLPSTALGAAYEHDLIVGDFNTGRLYRFALNAARDGFIFSHPGLADGVADNEEELSETIFGTGFGGITDVKAGPDGLVYVVSITEGKVFVIAPTGSATADLSLSKTSSPTPALIGQSMTYTLTITNNGPDAASLINVSDPLSSKLTFVSASPSQGTCHGSKLITCTLGDLAAGASATVELSVIPKSAGTISNTAEVAARPLDGTSSNNTATVSTTVIGPDLTINSLSAPNSAAPGATITVTVKTKNSGAVLADASTASLYFSTNNKWDDGDVFLTSWEVPALAAGAIQTSTASVLLPDGLATGVYYLIAKADSGGVVSETSESNNHRYRDLAVGPDLTINSLTAPSSATSGATIAVTVKTKNSGTVATAISSTTSLYFSTNSKWEAGDPLLTSWEVPPLAPAELHTASPSVTLPDGLGTGTYYLLAKADSGSAIVETRESNNQASRSFLVGPDLTISGVSSPSSAAPGATIAVTVKTKNSGTVAAEASSMTSLYFSTNSSWDAGDSLLTSWEVPALAPAAFHTATPSVTLPGDAGTGTYYLIAIADAGGTVVETKETNNRSSRAIAVGPDLTIDSLSAPSSAVPGATIAVTVKTKNSGAVTTATPSLTNLYFSTNKTWDAGDTLLTSWEVPALAPAEVHTGSPSVTLPDGFGAGTYHLIARADSGSAVVESKEENNTSYRKLTLAE